MGGLIKGLIIRVLSFKTKFIQEKGLDMSIKPVYRRGWFLIIIAVVLFGVGVGITFNLQGISLTWHTGPIYRCQSDDPVLLAPIAPIASLTSDGQSLYWLTRGNPGSVMKMSKITGKVQELSVLRSDPYGILVDNDFVYWVEGSWQPGPDFKLIKVKKRGGEVTELWHASESMMQLSMDADYLYWMIYETKTILRMPKKGGEPQMVVSGLEYFNNFSIVNGKIFLGGGDRLGVLDQQDQRPRILIATGQLFQDLHIGLRDERSVYFVGPVIQEYNNVIHFLFTVENYPGMISCTDNRVYMISLPESGGTAHIILNQEGSQSGVGVAEQYLYTIGGCSGGKSVNIDSGEISGLNISYDSNNLAVDKNNLYWTDQEGLKCMRRPK